MGASQDQLVQLRAELNLVHRQLRQQQVELRDGPAELTAQARELQGELSDSRYAWYLRNVVTPAGACVYSDEVADPWAFHASTTQACFFKHGVLVVFLPVSRKNYSRQFVSLACPIGV